MGKKKAAKKNQGPQVHPTTAFVHQVATAVMARSLAFAEQRIKQDMRSNLIKYIGDYNLDFQTLKRMARDLFPSAEAFDAKYAETKLDLEDEIFGVTKSDDAAEAGDFLRVKPVPRKIDAEGNQTEEWDTDRTPTIPMTVPRLTKPNSQGQFSLGSPEIEAKLVGAKAGDKVEVVQNLKYREENPETKELVEKETAKHFLIEVVRVSKPPKKTEPEGKDGTDSDDGEATGTDDAARDSDTQEG